MIKNFILVSCVGIFLCGGITVAFADVELKNFYARETAAQVKVGAAFGQLVNNGTEGDRLIAVSSPVCGHAEIHDMVMDGDVMRMRALDGVDIPAGGTLELAPGGKHIMLMELKDKLVVGEKIEVTFTFEHAGARTVSVPVNALSTK